MSDAKVDFVYLSEEDLIKAGILDGKLAVDTMCEVMSLLSEGDYLMGGNDGNSHGIALRFPKESPFENFPLSGVDRRYMAMPAYLGGRFHKVGQKWYGSNKENLKKGLPRSILMVTINDTDTGAPIAYMSGNLISAMRTAAVPFVAARYVTKPDPKVLSIIGAGQIGKASVICAMAEYPTIETIKIRGGSPDSPSAKKLAEYVKAEYPSVKDIIICGTLEEAVRDCDLICEAVSVRNLDDQPFIQEEWIKPGAVILSSMCLCFDDDFLINRASLAIDNWKMYVEFLEGALLRQKEEGIKRPFGVMGTNLLNLVNQGKLKKETVPLIGDYPRGIAPTRKSDDEIFVIGACGMPIEDVGLGYTMYENAMEKGLGTKLNLWNQPFLA